MAGYQLAMDYRTPFTTTSLTLANVDLFSNSGKVHRSRESNKKIMDQKIFSCLGIGVLQHLTRVTSTIDAGAELLYQASPMMPGGHIGIISLVAKYRGKIEKI